MEERLSPTYCKGSLTAIRNGIPTNYLACSFWGANECVVEGSTLLSTWVELPGRCRGIKGVLVTIFPLMHCMQRIAKETDNCFSSVYMNDIVAVVRGRNRSCLSFFVRFTDDMSGC